MAMPPGIVNKSVASSAPRSRCRRRPPDAASASAIHAPKTNISATSADPTMGSVAVLTVPSCQDTAAVVEATPAEGHLFVRWSDGNTDNPRTLVVAADTHLVAVFGMLIQDTVPYYDTTSVYDTVMVFDTIHITVSDTIYIYDTIIVEIDEVETINAKIYTREGQIVVEGAEGNTVVLFDVTGRLLATRRDDFQPLHFPVPNAGAYLIKIGNHPARKLVVL